MRVIYVSGAYRSKWGLIGKLVNIWKARRVAQELWQRGGFCICPHTNTALFKEDGIPYIEGDCEIIKRLRPNEDAIYMLRNWLKSEGARRELATAMDRRLTIYYE